jgi:HCOMODA/2-hydroxy-3-carboxy-muconic semialdehyde decarboxylase
MLRIRFEEATMTKRYRLTCLGAIAIFVALSGLAPSHAQTPPSPIPGVEPVLLEDIVAGSRILADLGVVDAFGHVSARHPTNPNRFLMSRSLAPALVTSGDVMEFDLDGMRSMPAAARCFWNASSTAKSTRRGRT